MTKAEEPSTTITPQEPTEEAALIAEQSTEPNTELSIDPVIESVSEPMSTPSAEHNTELNNEQNMPAQSPAKFIPTFAWMKRSPHRLLAFGFGSGLIKPAPGTWGTLMAWLLWQPINYLISHDILLAGLLVLSFAYGAFACQRVSQEMGVADHGGIVWDEIVAFWLVLFVISPLSLVWQLVAFVAFRFFDIIKPWPIGFFDERLKNGFGVMWDDIIAALYSLFVLAVLVRIVGV